MAAPYFPEQYHGATEDYLSGDMFTSQAPQDFPTVSMAPSTGINMTGIPAFDSFAMDSSLVFGEPLDAGITPSLTPTSESSFSSSSEPVAAWFDVPNQTHEHSSFDLANHVTQSMHAQSGLAYPKPVSWIDSPVSMPSNYGEAFSQELEGQLPFLEMPVSSYEASIPTYHVAPASLGSPDYMDQAYPMMDTSATAYSTGHTERRLSNESGPREARSDPRYKAVPGADGQYHCPMSDCMHPPEKLKCNYDKHLDAHLRPYRCKVLACQGTPFSSTACVLRHEREAHGMHGHGNKPFVCLFSDCERSQPQNGFPRKWNLGDHMKRVHGFKDSSLKKPSGPLTPPESPDMHFPGPTRTKRSSRTSPKVSKRSARTSAAQSRVDRSDVVASAHVPDMHQDYIYSPTSWEGNLQWTD